jgi:hypothetical protein
LDWTGAHLVATTDHTPSALATENLVIPQGATESATWPVSWLYAEGDPLDVPPGWPDSWEARMQIRAFPGSDEVLATLHSTDGVGDGDLLLDVETIETVDYARVTPFVPAAVSTGWTWGDSPEALAWDLELTNGTRVIRLVEGNVVLSNEVTTVA